MILNCLPILSVYGVTPLLNKHILKHISAEGYIFFSTIFYFIVALFFYVFMFQDTVQQDFIVLNKKPYLYLLIALYGFMILFIAEYLYFKVLHKNKVYLVTAILACYPIVTLFLAYCFFKESVNITHIIGVLMIVIGIILLGGGS